MRKFLKWLGIGLLILVGVLVVAVVGLSIAGNARLGKTMDVQAEAIDIPTDAESLARGELLVHTVCTGCHAEDLSGQPLLDDPAIGTVYAANISGLAETHTDDDMVKAIRHAVDTDGRQLAIMPAEAFINFSAEDLGAIIAYLKTVPRTGEDTPKPELGLMGRILMATGQFGQIFPAEYIDHDQPFHSMPEIGANVGYGEYMARFCTSCHGPDLAGAFPPGDPSSPFARNLTPGGDLKTWTEEDFLNFFKTGQTPDGRSVDPAYMPYESFGKFSEDELSGLWLYLQSLPALETPAE
ncbi:MAG TPA: c-type cytochrome [Anaerolineales bacterium]|nr:c-type cytochrome [Anaerolineales bacterium]